MYTSPRVLMVTFIKLNFNVCCARDYCAIYACSLVLVFQQKFVFMALKGGVQAYNFGNFYFEKRVEGEGQDTSRQFEGGFGSMRTIIYPCEASEQKCMVKHQNLNQKRYSFDFDTIQFVSRKQAILNKGSQNRIKNYRVMPLYTRYPICYRRARAWHSG